MRPNETDLQKVKNLLLNASNILVVSHRNPDGDTIGCALALKIALETQWHRSIELACADPIPDSFDYLPEIDSFVPDFNLEEYDLVIAVDVGAHYLLKFDETKPDLLKKDKPFINIDHHPSNDNFGTLNIVDADSASTSIIIFYLLEYLELQITPQIATCLLTGIYYDTGSFMHSNTTKEVYQVSSELIRRGADFRKIVKNLFHTTPVNQMHLWGKVLDRARINEESAIVSVVTEKDMKDCNATSEDLTGVIDYLNSVPETKFCMLLSEDMKGHVKGSFRTQNDRIDLSEIAAVFGGGGHKKAAGFSMPGKLQEKTTWDIVS